MEREKLFTDLASIRGLRSWAEGVKAGQVITIMPIAMNITLDLLDFIEKQQAVVEAARALMEEPLPLTNIAGDRDYFDALNKLTALKDALAKVEGKGE